MFWGIAVILFAALLCYFAWSQREGFRTELSALPKSVRYIKIFSNTFLQISQIKVLSGNINVAEGKSANATSEIVPGMANLAVDGTASARSFPDIYESNDSAASWEVDLGQPYPVDAIVYYNRKDCCTDRARSMVMTLYDNNRAIVGNPIYFTSQDLEQEFIFKKLSPSGTVVQPQPWRELPGNYAGNDISTTINSSPNACKTLCTNTLGCAGILFAKNTNTCWLKKSIPTKSVPDPFMTLYIPESKVALNAAPVSPPSVNPLPTIQRPISPVSPPSVNPLPTIQRPISPSVPVSPPSVVSGQSLPNVQSSNVLSPMPVQPPVTKQTSAPISIAPYAMGQAPTV